MQYKHKLIIMCEHSNSYTFTCNHHESITILFPPRMKIVTALEFLQPSITSILSFVVPKVSSRTIPACPSLLAVNSLNLGTIRPPVAIAINYNRHHGHYCGNTENEIIPRLLVFNTASTYKILQFYIKLHSHIGTCIYNLGKLTAMNDFS